MQPVQHRTSDGARPRTARRLPGRPVLKPVVPASETLARSTPFRNSSRNSTSPHLDPLTTIWAPQQGNALLEPALRPLPAPAWPFLLLPCPALPWPHSDPRHLHLTSRPSVQPPCSCCCSVFEDHLALALRPPPAINALPTHPYLVATVRYARPRLKHHPQSQERHVCSCLCSCWLVCGCVRLGTVRLTFQGPLHGMASHRVPLHRSSIPSHPIAPHRLRPQLRYVRCDIVCLLCCLAVLASPWPEQHLLPHCRHMPPWTALATYMLPAMSNLLQVCYRTEVFDSARPYCLSGTLNSIG